jgi:hypothetical protein
MPYSAPTGVLLAEYLRHRAAVSRARGPLFLPESRRTSTAPSPREQVSLIRRCITWSNDRACIERLRRSSPE